MKLLEVIIIASMAMVRVALYIAVVLAAGSRDAGAFWWPFSDGEDDNGEVETPPQPRLEADSRPVSFEMASAEQKFLAEAQQFLDLSPLEACQHRVGRAVPCMAVV